MEINLTNLNQINKSFKNLIPNWKQKQRTIFNKYSLLLETKIKEKTPRRTSTLVRSIHQRNLKEGFAIYTNLHYSKYVENGSKRQRAKKFFRKTFETYKPNIIRGITNDFITELNNR